MTTQPTHHGFAVNVKDHGAYVDTSPLTGEEVQAIYDRRAEDFWDLVQDVARDHGFEGAWSAGRMSGWCVPYPQPRTEDMYEHEIDSWLEHFFRPFEDDVRELMGVCREEFEADLAEARGVAIREPEEAAYWAARDVVTI